MGIKRFILMMLVVGFACTAIYAVEKKVSGLTEDSTPTGDDMAISNDGDTTTKKASWTNVFTEIGITKSSVTATYLYAEHNFVVVISSPVLLNYGTDYEAIPYNSYDITLITATARTVDGTNFVFMLEEQDEDGGSGYVWSGDVTTSSTAWTGGTFSDVAIASGSCVMIDPTSVSGDVSKVTIRGRWIRK